MPGCAAIGCNNRSEKGFTMKCFPRNPKLRKIWTERVSRADWEPSNNSFLCHVHFEADQWMISQGGRIKLKKNAIPTIFTVTSTRKSPRKRRKFANSEEDIFIIDYSDDSANREVFSRVKNSRFDSLTNSHLTTILGRAAYAQSCRTANKIVMNKSEIPETIVVSDDMSDTSVKERKRRNGVVYDCEVMDTTYNSEVRIKKESPPYSNHELDDIEEKLRSICDGEPQSDDKNTIEREVDKKNVIIEEKRSITKFSQDEKIAPKYLSSSKNEKSATRQENIGQNSSNQKRRSILETTTDAKKPQVTNVTNGIICEKENSEKPGNGMSGTMRKSTFTIKLTGIDEDVTEIVEGLGTEPILKYKSSNNSSNSNKNLVTSVISVTDTYGIKSENDEEETMRKVELRLRPSLEIKKETLTEINGMENTSSTKLSLESPEDDDDTMDLQRLRKKIKFQEDVIRKLTSQLNSSKEAQISTNYMSTRSQTKGKVMNPKTCNGDCQNDSKDKLLKDLSKKIDSSNETISRLHKSLNEERQNVKNALTQIRQRDNRIKELNWKLNKASKYIERAEKNANNYRKKMMNLQNFVAKRNLESEPCPSSNNSKSMERINIVETELKTVSSEVCPMETTEESYHDTTNEDVVYRTVQDIFEESNHGDDDPMIDNPEDFMRQFAGSL